MPVIRVKVDHAACSGIGSCHDVSPTFFQLDRENRAVVISNEGRESAAEQLLTVSVEEATQINAAAESCPMVAISVFDAAGNQLYG